MKEQILKKANEMFLTLGYKSVTMDDIAAELGISKKTIYLHFANKNDLVEASTLKLFEDISTSIDGICTDGHNPVEEFFVIRDFMTKALNNETASPIFQLQKFFPKVFTCLHTRKFEKMHGCMYQNLQRGIALGMYRKDVDVDFISRIYFTGLTGIKDAEVFPVTIYNANTLTLQYLEYHLRAIVTDAGLNVLTKTIAEINLKKS